MSGGESSSLDYLFGSGGEKQAEAEAEGSSAAPATSVSRAPWKDSKHRSSRKPPKSPSNKKTDVSNNYQRALQGQDLGKFVTGRPTPKVKSPLGGGETSVGVGYLSGDK